MKNIILLPFLVLTLHSFAQSEKSEGEEKSKSKGFKKEKLFTGGSVAAGFSTYSTVLGVAPQFGYSLTNWADAGIVFNLNYSSQRDYINYGDKLRQTVYGPGAFVRLFPVNFLFATAQYEFNFIHSKYIPADGTSPSLQNLNASSMLLGFGYAGGRFPGGNTYYYLSILWDVLGDKNSPYIDGPGRSYPIIRAGYNIGLFQNRRQRY